MANGTNGFSVVKVFSATKSQDREVLGERVTEWVREHSELTVVDTVITQSSDNAYHCLAIVIFAKARDAA